MLDQFQALNAAEVAALAFMGLLGIVAHYGLKLYEMRGKKHDLTLHNYYARYRIETFLSVMLVFAAIVGTVEYGIASPFTAFICGITCDVLANRFRNRAVNLGPK